MVWNCGTLVGEALGSQLHNPDSCAAEAVAASTILTEKAYEREYVDPQEWLPFRSMPLHTLASTFAIIPTGSAR